MKSKLLTAVAVVGIACSVSAMVLGFMLEQSSQAEKREAEVRANKLATSSYIRGFTDGVGSALDNINFNTNTGQFDLEFTNVIKDMKP
jgi:pyruvoyl-dependent arginine decarboxylase (PvlArgDC)